MSWKSYFFPQTICITSSPYNQLIRVNEEQGKLKLLVNGSRQSGVYIEGLWKKTFRAFSIRPDVPIHSILVLGVGGGTVITLLHDYFPHAAITGVDIDSVIVEIAMKYFHVDQIAHTAYICKDAKLFVKEAKVRKKQYDLIVVDLFSGRMIPEFVQNKEFISSIQSLLNKKGILLINYLREKEYGKKSNKLFKLLLSVCKHVQDFPIAYNRFFCAKKE